MNENNTMALTKTVTPKQNCPKATQSRKSLFKQFVENQSSILSKKYPFLQSVQIHKKATELWASLTPNERELQSTAQFRPNTPRFSQVTRRKFFTTHNSDENGNVGEDSFSTPPGTSKGISEPNFNCNRNFRIYGGGTQLHIHGTPPEFESEQSSTVQSSILKKQSSYVQKARSHVSFSEDQTATNAIHDPTNLAGCSYSETNELIMETIDGADTPSSSELSHPTGETEINNNQVNNNVSTPGERVDNKIKVTPDWVTEKRVQLANKPVSTPLGKGKGKSPKQSAKKTTPKKTKQTVKEVKPVKLFRNERNSQQEACPQLLVTNTANNVGVDNDSSTQVINLPKTFEFEDYSSSDDVSKNTTGMNLYNYTTDDSEESYLFAKKPTSSKKTSKIVSIAGQKGKSPNKSAMSKTLTPKRGMTLKIPGSSNSNTGGPSFFNESPYLGHSSYKTPTPKKRARLPKTPDSSKSNPEGMLFETPTMSKSVKGRKKTPKSTPKKIREHVPTGNSSIAIDKNIKKHTPKKRKIRDVSAVTTPGSDASPIPSKMSKQSTPSSSRNPLPPVSITLGKYTLRGNRTPQKSPYNESIKKRKSSSLSISVDLEEELSQDSLLNYEEVCPSQDSLLNSIHSEKESDDDEMNIDANYPGSNSSFGSKMASGIRKVCPLFNMNEIDTNYISEYKIGGVGEMKGKDKPVAKKFIKSKKIINGKNKKTPTKVTSNKSTDNIIKYHREKQRNKKTVAVVKHKSPFKDLPIYALTESSVVFRMPHHGQSSESSARDNNGMAVSVSSANSDMISVSDTDTNSSKASNTAACMGEVTTISSNNRSDDHFIPLNMPEFNNTSKQTETISNGVGRFDGNILSSDRRNVNDNVIPVDMSAAEIYNFCSQFESGTDSSKDLSILSSVQKDSENGVTPVNKSISKGNVDIPCKSVALNSNKRAETITIAEAYNLSSPVETTLKDMDDGNYSEEFERCNTNSGENELLELFTAKIAKKPKEPKRVTCYSDSNKKNTNEAGFNEHDVYDLVSDTPVKKRPKRKPRKINKNNKNEVSVFHKSCRKAIAATQSRNSDEQVIKSPNIKSDSAISSTLSSPGIGSYAMESSDDSESEQGSQLLAINMALRNTILSHLVAANDDNNWSDEDDQIHNFEALGETIEDNIATSSQLLTDDSRIGSTLIDRMHECKQVNVEANIATNQNDTQESDADFEELIEINKSMSNNRLGETYDNADDNNIKKQFAGVITIQESDMTIVNRAEESLMNDNISNHECDGIETNTVDRDKNPITNDDTRNKYEDELTGDRDNDKFDDSRNNYGQEIINELDENNIIDINVEKELDDEINQTEIENAENDYSSVLNLPDIIPVCEGISESFNKSKNKGIKNKICKDSFSFKVPPVPHKCGNKKQKAMDINCNNNKSSIDRNSEANSTPMGNTSNLQRLITPRNPESLVQITMKEVAKAPHKTRPVVKSCRNSKEEGSTKIRKVRKSLANTSNLQRVITPRNPESLVQITMKEVAKAPHKTRPVSTVNSCRNSKEERSTKIKKVRKSLEGIVTSLPLDGKDNGSECNTEEKSKEMPAFNCDEQRTKDENYNLTLNCAINDETEVNNNYIKPASYATTSTYTNMRTLIDKNPPNSSPLSSPVSTCDVDFNTNDLPDTSSIGPSNSALGFWRQPSLMSMVMARAARMENALHRDLRSFDDDEEDSSSGGGIAASQMNSQWTLNSALRSLREAASVEESTIALEDIDSVFSTPKPSPALSGITQFMDEIENNNAINKINNENTNSSTTGLDYSSATLQKEQHHDKHCAKNNENDKKVTSSAIDDEVNKNTEITKQAVKKAKNKNINKSEKRTTNVIKSRVESFMNANFESMNTNSPKKSETPPLTRGKEKKVAFSEQLQVQNNSESVKDDERDEIWESKEAKLPERVSALAKLVSIPEYQKELPHNVHRSLMELFESPPPVSLQSSSVPRTEDTSNGDSQDFFL